MPNDIQIGPVTFHVYGLMIAIGFIAAYLICEKRAKKKGFDEDIIWGILVCAILGILIGSRLLFHLVNLPEVIKDPSMLWNFNNGYVVYGGILFGVLFGYLYCRYKRVSFLSYFDLVMPAVAVAQGFGRIGCFFAGCCYGKQTDSAFHIVYNYSRFAPNGIPLIPTQLMSSAGNFAIAAILFAYARKKRQPGAVGGLYMLLYSTGRFIIECFRGDLRGGVGVFSTSQVISIVVFLAGAVWMLQLQKMLDNKEKLKM